MTENEFNELVDETLQRIEDAIDEQGLDIDCENAAGILTLEMENGSQIVISRQSAQRELWMAARSGGFHYARAEGQQTWQSTRQGEASFIEALNAALVGQGASALELTV